MSLFCYETNAIWIEPLPGKGMVADIYIDEPGKLAPGKRILLDGKAYFITDIIDYTGFKEDTIIGVAIRECGVDYELHKSR